MAQRTIIQLTDDIDGKDLGDDGETVSFGLDGTNYEIDLSAKNADKLRGLIYDYASKGRKVGGSGRTKTSTKYKANGPAAAEVRTWAKENGYDVPERGRIPATVREAYDAAV